VASFLVRARRGKAKRRTRHPYAKRKPRTYAHAKARRPDPGGHPDRRPGPREAVKHSSAVDIATRLSLAEVDTRAAANLAAGFLAYLITQAPFHVWAIQVDGGSKFMAEQGSKNASPAG